MWENNYSGEVGKMVLFFNRHKLPHSLAVTLFHRQLGRPRSDEFFNFKIETHISRQLIASRAPANSEVLVDVGCHVMGPENIKKTQSKHVKYDPKNKWFLQICGFDNNGGVDFIRGHFVVTDRDSNTKIFFEPYGPLMDSQFFTKFSIPIAPEIRNTWRDEDIYTIDKDVPRMIHFFDGDTVQKVMKLPNTLLILQNLKVLAYDVNTGRRLDELSLAFHDGPENYNSIMVDNFLDDRIYISSKRSAKNSDFELLIVSYPPLFVCYRLLFPNVGDFHGVDEICTFQGLLMTSSSTDIELFSLNQVLGINSDLETGLETKELIVTHKPSPVLARLKSLRGFFLCISDSSPPYVCIERKNAYQILRLDKPKEIIAMIPKDDDTDIIVESYTNYQSRIVVLGLAHGFDIFEMNTTQKCLKLIFSTTNFSKNFSHSQPLTVSVQPTRRRQGLRKLAKRNYADMCLGSSQIFGYHYNKALDLVAVCMLENAILYTNIYDNKDMACFKQLTPVQISRENGMTDHLLLAVEPYFIAEHLHVIVTSVRSGSESIDIYVANLLGEMIFGQDEMK